MDTDNETQVQETPTIDLPPSVIEEVALSAMKDVYNQFQDELLAIEEEAKKEQVHGE